MTPILVVEHLVVLDLPFEIGLAPKPDRIQILAPDGSDQSLDESMRTRRCGHGVGGELQFMRHFRFEIDRCSVAASDTTEVFAIGGGGAPPHIRFRKTCPA